jgi:hypothetical protein
MMGKIKFSFPAVRQSCFLRPKWANARLAKPTRFTTAKIMVRLEE